MKSVQNNLDFWPSTLLLFTIAFGPAFIALNLKVFVTQKTLIENVNYTNIGVIVVFLIFFILNTCSVMMLNVAYKTKLLGSFQEMAWSTSSNNRGYIFLISAMKVIYLVITSAYCISFIACYFTSIIQCIFVRHSTIHAWWSYVIYAIFILLVTALAYFVQFKKQPDQIYDFKTPPKIFAAAISFSILLAAIFLIVIASSPTKDISSTNIGYGAEQFLVGGVALGSNPNYNMNS
jgi:hypothetical protein